MASQKQLMTVGVVALVALAGAMLYGQFGAKSGLAGTNQTVVTTQGACPSTGMTQMAFKATTLNSSNSMIETQQVTTAAIYKSGENTLLGSASTGLSGYSNITLAPCGVEATAFIGDGGTTYYYVEKDLTASMTSGAITYTTAQLKQQSAATIAFSNTSAFGQAAVTVAGVGAGGTSSDAVLRVKAGQEYFGDGSFEVCARYNMTNVTSVSFGSNAQQIATDPNIAGGTNLQVKCYEVKQQLYNFNYIDLPVVIQARAAVTPVGSIVDIYVNDKSAYLKNGNAIQAYWNGDTNADIGATVVSKTTAITINP